MYGRPKRGCFVTASQSAASRWNCADVRPACVAAISLKKSASGSFAMAARSPSSTVLNGCSSRQPGLAAASALMRSTVNSTSTYIGCSVHSVPSLSNVAMRSAGGTKPGLPGCVVSVTNRTIAALVAPAFHDGSGSAGGSPAHPARTTAATSSAAQRPATESIHPLRSRTCPSIVALVVNWPVPCRPASPV